jgi:hypothetical protein
MSALGMTKIKLVKICTEGLCMCNSLHIDVLRTVINGLSHPTSSSCLVALRFELRAVLLLDRCFTT